MNELQEKNLRVYSGFEVTPQGWDETTVGQICDLGRGRVISQDEINNKPGQFPVFSSQTRNNGEMGRLATFDFSGEYVTWTTDGENAGTVFFRSGQFNCTNVCGTLRPKSSFDLDLRFLTYQLGSVAKRYVSYVGNPKLMNGVMASVGLILPPKKQQRRIAEILSTVDELMEQTEALIAKYQQIKAGLMHDLFTRGVTPDGQLRPTRAQAPQLYKNSPRDWIPKEWDTELLDDIALRGSGHTPNRNRPDFWNGGIKWLSLADSWRLDRLYVSDTDKEISELGIANSSAVLHPQGIVVLSRDAGIGKSAITTCSMAVSQHFMCWRCGPRLGNHFLYYWLQFHKREFENIATGTTIPTIGLRYFKHYRINLPTDIEEQRQIGEMMLSLDTTIFAEENQLSKLRALKRGLMQDLLTGRVPVRVAGPAMMGD